MNTITAPAVRAQCDRADRVTRSLLGYGIIAGPMYVLISLAQAVTRDGFDLARHEWSLLALEQHEIAHLSSLSSVPVNTHSGDPSADHDHGCGKGKIGGLTTTARGDGGEAGEKDNSDEPRRSSPPPPILGGRPSREYEAGRTQAGEAEDRYAEVGEPVPADFARPFWRADREAQCRISPEHSRRDQAHTVATDEPGTPHRSRTASQRSA